MKRTTINKEEIDKFSKIADEWWSPDGKFVYNPPRHIEAPGPEVVTFDYALSDDCFVLCDSRKGIALVNSCNTASKAVIHKFGPYPF